MASWIRSGLAGGVTMMRSVTPITSRTLRTIRSTSRRWKSYLTSPSRPTQPFCTWMAAARLSAAIYPMAAIQVMVEGLGAAAAVPHHPGASRVRGAATPSRPGDRRRRAQRPLPGTLLAGPGQAVAAVTLANIAGFSRSCGGAAIIGAVPGDGHRAGPQPAGRALPAAGSGPGRASGRGVLVAAGRAAAAGPGPRDDEQFPGRAALIAAGGLAAGPERRGHGGSRDRAVAVPASRVRREQLPAVQVACVYLAGASAGAISPTPGGLGAVEATLVGTLARVRRTWRDCRGQRRGVPFRYLLRLPALPGAPADPRAARCWLL